MSFLVCARCGHRLTTAIQQQEAPPADRDVPGKPLVVLGTYATSWNYGFVLHPHDVKGAERHADSRRWSGCCGPSGLDGPNLICSGCQTEIGTQESDCWKPHFVVTLPDATQMRTDRHATDSDQRS
ncbi:hypothetical protein GCM10009850_119470 [Nonomuraea monospora]|uniref:Uncharacterized protein n=1 Tax=Nonomuraea monospora TaxID=568818 RepID=A0ABN3D3U2_9ACTN